MPTVHKNQVTRRTKDSAEQQSKAEAVAVLKQLLPVLQNLVAKQQGNQPAQSDADNPNALVPPSVRAASKAAAADAGYRAGLATANVQRDADAAMLKAMGGVVGDGRHG